MRRIEIYIDQEGEYRFRLVADNGEIIAYGQGYGKKDDLMDTVRKYFPEWVVKDATGE